MHVLAVLPWRDPVRCEGAFAATWEDVAAFLYHGAHVMQMPAELRETLREVREGQREIIAGQIRLEDMLAQLLAALSEDDPPEQTLDGEPAGRERDSGGGLG